MVRLHELLLSQPQTVSHQAGKIIRLRYKALAWNCLWMCALASCVVSTRVVAQTPEGEVDLTSSLAVLVIQRPANAELELVGEKTTWTGPSRRFKTPALAAGREHDDPIKATFRLAVALESGFMTSAASRVLGA